MRGILPGGAVWKQHLLHVHVYYVRDWSMEHPRVHYRHMIIAPFLQMHPVLFCCFFFFFDKEEKHLIEDGLGPLMAVTIVNV